MQKNEVINFWNSELRSKLLIEFSRCQKEYLKGKGDLVDGIEVCGPCNQVFGFKVHENAISIHGLAIVLQHKQLHIPLIVVGVSVKDFQHPKPMTYYKMMYIPRDERWVYDVTDFKGDDTDFFYLAEKLNTEFKTTGYAMVKDNLPFE